MSVDTQNLPHQKDELSEAVGNASQEAFGTKLPEKIPDKEIKQEWRDTLTDARCSVTFCTPLLAYMMFQCEYVWTYEVPTAGALPHNGKNLIFINPTFWLNGLKNREERAFVLLHEISHIFLEHCGRQVDQGYNAKLWNIAADYNINLTCSGTYKDEDGSVKVAQRYQQHVQRPKLCLYDERFIGMTSDAIYHLLIEENGGSAEKALEAHGYSMPDENGEPQMGSGNANGQMPLDEVSQVGAEGSHGNKNRRTASAAVANASMSKDIGESEGDMVTAIDGLSKPKVDWREQLASAVMSSTKERPTYNRLSRRTSGDVKFPSLTGFKVKGVYGVDSSRSMSEQDYRDSASELRGLLDQFEAWELEFVTCDVGAHHIGSYASEDGDDFESVDLEFRGGGGTEMSPISKFANDFQDEEGDVAFCIIVTDGYIPEQPLEEELDDSMVNIVLVTSNGNKNLTLENAKVIQMSDMS